MSILPNEISRYSTVYDPYSFEPYSLDLSEVFHRVAEHYRNYTRAVVALSKLQMAWKETPDAHVFKANLPGTHLFTPEACDAALSKLQIDWKETPNAHVFKADLPGIKKEDVKIVMTDGSVLEISGELIADVEQEGETFYWIERQRGRFLRRFRLSENAKVEEVKAEMENGVLTVTVPKDPQSHPESKAVEISG